MIADIKDNPISDFGIPFYYPICHITTVILSNIYKEPQLKTATRQKKIFVTMTGTSNLQFWKLNAEKNIYLKRKKESYE